MGELAGDIDEQLAALKGVAEDIHTVRDIKAMMAEMEAGRRMTPDRSCSHGDYTPGEVTYTEIYDGEGFRPFG